VVLEWFWSGFGVVLEWFWSGFGVVLEWFWIDCDWFWSGFVLFVLFVLFVSSISFSPPFSPLHYFQRYNWDPSQLAGDEPSLGQVNAKKLGFNICNYYFLQDYYNHNFPIASLRMEAAGVRLATVLNTAFQSKV
jgi:hypothetical protein